MIKIKRPIKKVLNEDDALAQPAVAQPAAQPALTPPPAAPTQTPAPAPAAQPAAPAQQDTTQLDQQTQQLQPSQDQQKITDAVNTLLGKDKIGNTYWVMSVNLPEEILKMIPEFKTGNQKAEPAIKAWEEYKKEPTQAKYNTFLDEFKKFGMPEQVQQLQLPNQQAQAQPAATTLPAASAQPVAQPAAPANNFMQTERLLAAFNFNKALQENLNTAYKKNYYKNVLIDYFENI